MGDEDRRDAEPLLQSVQFRLHALAQTLVERSERLVKQQHRFDDQCPGQRESLGLRTGCAFSNRCPHVEPPCNSTEPALENVQDHQVACRLWQELRSDARAT